MLKRGSGLFKITFFTEIALIVIFLAMVTMTNVLTLVKVEWCLGGLFLACVILPLLIESFIYSIGKATKKIKKETKEFVFPFEPVSEDQAYVENISDGTVKCLFFTPNNQVVVTKKTDTDFTLSGTNEIILEKAAYICHGFYRDLYETAPILCYHVKTTVIGDYDNSHSVATGHNQKDPDTGYTAEGYAAPEEEISCNFENL